jgi:polyisoprenoid-binding protein YceI
MAVLGFSRFTVKFTRLEGSLEHDPNRPERSRVSITVDPRSAAASNAAAARRTVALFEPDRYPTISFASRGVSSQDGREQLAGDLTLHGVTRPVTLDLNVRSIEAGTPGRPARVSFSGAGRIRRSDFAVVALRGVVGDQVDLLFDVDFVAR